MRIDVNIHAAALDSIDERLHHLERTIMSTQAQLAADLQSINAAVQKIGTETQSLISKVDALQAALDSAGNTTPEVDAALQAVRDSVNAVDSLVPDAPAP